MNAFFRRQSAEPHELTEAMKLLRLLLIRKHRRNRNFDQLTGSQAGRQAGCLAVRQTNLYVAALSMGRGVLGE